MKKPLKSVLKKIVKPICNNLLKLKNCHKNESCYIFGDGLSIKFFDLEAFPKKITFALNFFPFHNKANILDTKYKIITAPYWFYPYYRWQRNNLKDVYLDLIKKEKNSDYFISLSNYPVLRGSNIFHLFVNIDDPEFEFFRECEANKVNTISSSFRTAISLSLFMGFKEIILVGCDYTHEISKSRHWYEKGNGVLKPQYNYQKKFLKIAEKYAKIITITTKGDGSVLPGISYTEFTGHHLSYNENYNLMDIKTLKLLHKFGYKTF